MNGRLKVTARERIALEPFGSLDSLLTGLPFKIFSVGRWYREERTLDITPDRLKQFSANLKAGLPRFRIPINIEHDRTLGTYGGVDDVEYTETGTDGPGLYATRYELTDEGRKLVEQKKFPGVSGEAIWTLNNGAKYQDPKTGKYFDNVLAGVAMTSTPFFGNDVALFTAFPDQFKDFSPERRKELADSGAALPDGSYPIESVQDLANAIQAVGRATNRAQVMAHIKKRARALGAEDRLPPEWMADNQALFHAQHDQSTHGHGGGGSAESNTQELPAHAQKDIERGLWTEKEARIANDPSQSREERARAFKNREVTQAAAHTSYRDGNSVKGVLDQEISSGAIKLERSGTRTYLTNPNTGTQLPLKLPVEREYASVALSRQGFANKLETDSMTDIQPGDMPMDKPKRHNGYTKLR